MSTPKGMSTPDSIEQARREGYQTYQKRRGINPYPMHTPEAQAFNEGWDNAKAEDSAGHPWAKFLAARADVIDWLYSGEGDPACKGNDRIVATSLSMDTVQVTMIRTRDRAHEARPATEPKAG